MDEIINAIVRSEKAGEIRKNSRTERAQEGASKAVMDRRRAEMFHVEELGS